MDQPPQTPSRPAVAEPQSTPLSKGSASTITRITGAAKFKQQLNNYLAPITRETDLYHPFVELANQCVAELVGNDRPVFCRNDPIIVRGSDAARKPDVVALLRAILQRADRESEDGMSEGGPAGAAFHWRELLSFWEFKATDITPSVSVPATASKKPEKKSKQPTVDAPDVRRSTRTTKTTPSQPIRLNETPRSTSKQRTGTKPYMSYDLLVPNPPVHVFRHDLESFLYVLVFLTCEIRGSPLAEWKYQGMRQLNLEKSAVLTTHPFPPIKDEFKQFKKWINNLTLMFGDGISKQRSHRIYALNAQDMGIPHRPSMMSLSTTR
ncbi:hypothetical protein B0H13DRAFT_2285691 [Mycena leptocephala]|nr:hypothetical protein B0H13DRAFT_2285691 [Mycena leptocephala]